MLTIKCIVDGVDKELPISRYEKDDMGFFNPIPQLPEHGVFEMGRTSDGVPVIFTIRKPMLDIFEIGARSNW